MQEKLEYIENKINEKYGSNIGISTLEEYIKTNNINTITNYGNARDLMREIPIEEVIEYLKRKENIRNIKMNLLMKKIMKTEKLKEEQVKLKLQKYVEEKNIAIFTRKNHLREKISEIEIEDIKRYITE